MRIGEIEITLREAIFSVTIASVLFFIGFLISTKIEHGVNQRNLKYRQAVQISTPSEFSQGMKTDIGHAFVQGRWEALSPVSHPKLEGEWGKIHANHQEYRMHTRVETYTTYDSKGHAHTHTRIVHYWTWDTYKTTSTNSPTVKYIGSEFPFQKFNYTAINREWKTVGNGFRKRIVFTMIPTNFQAAAFTTLKDGTLTPGTTLWNTTIQKLYEDFTTSHAVTIFWTLWVMIMVAIVIGFVCIENSWIEDGEERKEKRNDNGKRTDGRIRHSYRRIRY